MKIRKLVCAIAGVVALAGLDGCQTDDHSSDLSHGRRLDDRHINERVKKELKSDGTYKFEDIKVSTFAGVVQLSGFANSDAQKQRAQSIVQNVPGVLRVENGITVKPSPPVPPAGRTNANNRIYPQ
jgi:hyperosmotically inducible periplasmic protein